MRSSVFYRSGRPPRGPAGCLRSPNSRGHLCDTCGQRPVVIHMPIGRAGWFDSQHCPLCNRRVLAQVRQRAS